MAQNKIIRQAEDFGAAVAGMRQAMAKASVTTPDQQLKIDEFKKKHPDAIYVQPTVRIPTGGVKHPEMEKQRDHLWERVIGIFESQMITGKIEFFLGGLPSDDYCKWEIPVNKPVGVPRFVAIHLSQNLGWKEMKPLGRDNQPKDYYEEEMMAPFGNFEYKKRGHFYPINSY